MTTDTAVRSKVSTLELVYPPISTQEAVWLENDAEVEALLRQSDFYMIVGRAEASFEKIDFDPDTGCLTFQFCVGDDFADDVVIDLRDRPAFVAHQGEDYEMEIGPKLIRIWSGEPRANGSEVVDWFTTEKLLFERWRGHPGIRGFERYREAATYDLLYVGIAKVGDSFDRLMANGHKARMTILGNEAQRKPGARVADEIYLLMFRVDPVGITTFSLGHDFTDADFDPTFESKRIVADAEKAFVHLLDPSYNKQKFANYPHGKDGLYGAGYVRYGYNLIENLTLRAPNGDFKGGRDVKTGYISNGGDAIFVAGDQVQLLVSGVDFPADYAEQVAAGLWDAPADDEGAPPSVEQKIGGHNPG